MRAWPAASPPRARALADHGTGASKSLAGVVTGLSPPVRTVEFWATQVLVLAIAAVHDAIEGFGLMPHLGLLYFVPISFFFIPIVYAAVKFGFRGAMATALLCVVINIPNWIVWHSGFARWGSMFQMSVMVGTGMFVGSRVDEQMQALARAEKASRALEDSELKYRGLFETAGDGVLLLESGGHIVECNTAAGQLMGEPPEDLRNRHIAEIPQPDLVVGLLDLANGDETRTDVKLSDHDGSDLWLELVASPLVPGTGITQVVLRNVSDQKRRQAGLETYAAQILRAQEDERHRIAQDLHDETVQSLVLLCRKLDAVGARELGISGFARVREAREYAESIAESLRGFIGGLRPPILDDLGLVPALRRQVSDLASAMPIDCEFVNEHSHRPTPDVELALFRIAQEALHNVERHSGASRVRVSLDIGETCAKLAVVDNGAGFAVPVHLNDLANENKLGLLGMQERARILGGTFIITSSQRSGTEVVVEVPCG